MPILKAYAIISREGMIANADGSFPAALKCPGDQHFFRSGLRAADILIHGANSGEDSAETAQCARIVLTRQVDAVARHPRNEHAVLWNPRGTAFAAALELLGMERAHSVAAILGGTEVFGLFLGIGYDAFYLSCADVSVPVGRAVFPGTDTPQAQLAAHGLVRRESQELDAVPQVMLERWYRAP